MREQLRAATAPLHATVDAAMPLAQPHATLADYQRHLLVLQDWFAALSLALPGLPGLAQEQRGVARDAEGCARLLGDAGTAAPPPPGVLAALRGLADGPQSEAARWGVRYVIEGSHLGGQVLYRRLAAALAPHPLDYLRGAGPGAAAPGARWRQFLLGLAEQRWDTAAQGAATEAARHAFELLIACLHARQMRQELVPS